MPLVSGRFSPAYWPALFLFALWPVINLLARQSPPLVAGVMVVLLLAAALTEGRAAEIGQGVKRLVRTPEFSLAMIGLALVWISAAGSPAGKRALQSAGQMSFGLVGCTALALASRFMPREVRERSAIIVALVGIPALVLAVKFWPQAHQTLGVRDQVSNTNRTALLLALLLPVAMFWAERRRGLIPALALGAAMLGAVLFSHSESAKLGAVVAIAMVVLHRGLGRGIIWIATGAALLVMLAAPWIAKHIYDIVPGFVFRNTEAITVAARADIWSAYGLAALQKPWLGWGFEMSFDPMAALDASRFSEAQIHAMKIGHTHNAPLQIWLELGAAGAAVSVLLIVVAARRILRIADAGVRSAAAAFASCAFAIATVSHGAWQVWWYLLVALVAVLVPRMTDGAGDRPDQA